MELYLIKRIAKTFYRDRTNPSKELVKTNVYYIADSTKHSDRTYYCNIVSEVLTEDPSKAMMFDALECRIFLKKAGLKMNDMRNIRGVTTGFVAVNVRDLRGEIAGKRFGF